MLVVLAFDIEGPEDAPGILRAIDPPSLPMFDGTARVVPEPFALELVAWLDESNVAR
jgi:hypothetical protein